MLISPFDPWKSKFCTCPEKYSLSPYTGCGHGCLYCYARSYIRGFDNPRPKKDFLKRVQVELKRLPDNSFITIANSSDPYQPIENDYRLTESLLKLLKEFNHRLMLVTKSDLILRDIDLIKKFSRIVVAISITTLNPELARILEPFAPPPERRIETVKKLSELIPVAVRVDPLIPGINTEENDLEKLIKAVKDAGAVQIITSTYKSRVRDLNLIEKHFPALEDNLDRLYRKEGEVVNGYRYLKRDLRYRLIKRMAELSSKYDLKFSSCREGFTNLNTALCDGSSHINR